MECGFVGLLIFSVSSLDVPVLSTQGLSAGPLKGAVCGLRGSVTAVLPGGEDSSRQIHNPVMPSIASILAAFPHQAGGGGGGTVPVLSTFCSAH